MSHPDSSCNLFNQRSIQPRFNYGQNRPAGNHSFTVTDPSTGARSPRLNFGHFHPLRQPGNIRPFRQGTRPKTRYMGIWEKKTIKVDKLRQYLSEQVDAEFLLEGFSTGFRIQYVGPRVSVSCRNLISALHNEDVAWEKVMQEVQFGRIAGPFQHEPISNLICSQVGLDPKKTTGFRLKTHLSHPSGNSVNDFIDPALSSVSYSSFDNAVSMIKKSGNGALIGKMDCQSAFRLLPCYLGDLDLLGFTLRGQYLVDKMVPMGLKIACKCWECLA